MVWFFSFLESVSIYHPHRPLMIIIGRFVFSPSVYISDCWNPPPASLCQKPQLWATLGLVTQPTADHTSHSPSHASYFSRPTPVAAKAGNFHLAPPSFSPPTRSGEPESRRLRAQPGLGRLPSLRKALICTLAGHWAASPPPGRREGRGPSASRAPHPAPAASPARAPSPGRSPAASVRPQRAARAAPSAVPPPSAAVPTPSPERAPLTPSSSRFTCSAPRRTRAKVDRSPQPPREARRGRAPQVRRCARWWVGGRVRGGGVVLGEDLGAWPGSEGRVGGGDWGGWGAVGSRNRLWLTPYDPGGVVTGASFGGATGVSPNLTRGEHPTRGTPPNAELLCLLAHSLAHKHPHKHFFSSLSNGT